MSEIALDLYEGGRAGLATPGHRWLAQVLDGLISYVPYLLLAIVIGKSSDLRGIALLAAFAWLLFYLLFADGFAGGRSWGKRILSTAVIDSRTGAPCGFGQSFVRNVFLLILGPIDWLFIFGPSHQRLGDKVAKTLVIRLAG